MSSIRINRVYTRSGDAGETGLVGGARVSKSDLRVECYGEVDELNSHLGLLKEHIASNRTSIRECIFTIQQELFDMGAELATAPDALHEQRPRVIASEHVERLEQWCDLFNSDLPELTSFILPGGSIEVAQLHVCRTVCRRAERRLVALQQVSQSENPELLRYLNRLSDFFFVLARYLLADKKIEPGQWIDPQKRPTPSIE